MGIMSRMAVNENIIVVTKGLHIECCDHETSKILSISLTSSQKDDEISDIAFSSNNKHLAALTSTSKQLILYELPSLKEQKVIVLPRSASKIRFTNDSKQILVADKTGDGLIYNISTEENGTKLLGHLSLLLNILQTSDHKYIITSDRDEKIRVTCYPNTYIIHTYCLGHKEFVNNIELLPHDEKYLISTSGDGTIKCWNYEEGKLCCNIDTDVDVNDKNLLQEFIQNMDEDGLEVDRLPILNLTTMKVNHSQSLIAITVHLVKKIFIYSFEVEHEQFNHKMIETLKFDAFPSAIQFFNSSLFVFIESTCEFLTYKITIDQQISVDFVKKISIFKNIDINPQSNSSNIINVLYKRKFDNVQEYHQRKKKRLGLVA